MIEPIGLAAGRGTAELASSARRPHSAAGVNAADFGAAFAAVAQPPPGGCNCGAGQPAAVSGQPAGTRAVTKVSARPAAAVTGLGNQAATTSRATVLDQLSGSARPRQEASTDSRLAQTCGTCGEPFRVDDGLAPTAGAAGTEMSAATHAGAVATSLALARWRPR